jgi:chitin synthase
MDGGPAPPYTTGAPAGRYGPSGPMYAAPVPDPYAGLVDAPPTLPFFEAALARSRGVPIDYGHTPSYLPPPDPNHPDIAVGFSRNQSIRHAGYSRSRSPSPVREYHAVQGGHGQEAERAPLTDTRYHSPYLPLDEKDVDLALPPFQGETSPPRLLSAPPSLYRKVDQQDHDFEGDLAGGVTQHFGPAPTGRIGRRTHNADGHRRIKHTATLDDNGFFAVDMPIPTRLAQFLPFKGVEEQKTTR